MPRSVLVVDAKETNRFALKAALSAARYNVDVVGTGRAAMDFLAEKTPDLVLCDAVLPDMSSAELCAAMQHHSPKTASPVVILTDVLQDEDRLATLQAGADTLLKRPLERSWLLTNIRALLRAHQTQIELRRRNLTALRLGFAEPMQPFHAPARVGIVSGLGKAPSAYADLLGGWGQHSCLVLDPETAIAVADERHAPEAFVLAGDLSLEDMLWVLSELRSRPETRRAAILVEYAPDALERGARALDMGANDLLEASASAEEIALRIDRQLKRKRDADRLRASVDEGLALAARDSLTGLFNRRYALHHLAQLAENDFVEGRGYGVLMLDIDHFKQVNDSFGHSAGDEVLTTMAACLRNNMRELDLVARMGGEEFLIALPDTSRAEASAAAERIRQSLARISFDAEGHAVGITVSIGVACSLGNANTPTDVIQAADDALYEAKKAGRNRVASAQITPQDRHFEVNTSGEDIAAEPDLRLCRPIHER